MRGIRQHVNPLSARYRAARAEPLLRPAAVDPAAPIEVELGCADAQFAFALARAFPERWIVGLEIREPWVRENRARADRQGLRNLTFAYCNVNVDLERVFAPGSVRAFHVLFPDPWIAARHHKRRMFGDRLLATLAGLSTPEGELHVATDVFDLALDALAELERTEGWVNLAGPWGFSRQAPHPYTSRREDTTRGRGQRIWRIRARRRAGR